MPKSFKQLAYEVLRAEGKPMHYVDLTSEVLKLRKTDGKTPAATLRMELAEDHRFVKVKRGIYGLSEWKKRS